MNLSILLRPFLFPTSLLQHAADSCRIAARGKGQRVFKIFSLVAAALLSLSSYMAELSSSFDLRQSFCVSNLSQKFFFATILQTDVRKDEGKFEFKSGKKADNLSLVLVALI